MVDDSIGSEVARLETGQMASSANMDGRNGRSFRGTVRMMCIQPEGCLAVQLFGADDEWDSFGHSDLLLAFVARESILMVAFQIVQEKNYPDR